MKVPPSLRSKFFIDGVFSPLKVLSPEEALQLNKECQKYVEKFGNNGKLGMATWKFLVIIVQFVTIV